MSIQLSTIQILWKPHQKWFKLNINGLSQGNLGIREVGGIIRESNENWILGFSRNLGSVCVNFGSIRDGISLACSMGFESVYVKTNATSAKTLIWIVLPLPLHFYSSFWIATFTM